MLEFIEQEKLRVEEILRNDIAHKDKEVVYILYKQDTHETKILACNPASDEALEFPAYTEDHFLGYTNIPYWDYNYDQYIYELLEYGWKIGYMTPEIHYSIWNSINELYPESIDYKNGVQNYLQYCIENGITKEFLDKTTNLDTPNIMQFLEDKENETYNNMTILEKGDRKGQPIALVKRAIGEETEYVIAFNYEIKDNALTWGYGYYYSNDIKKAHQDYEKVIGGGNLANTFRNEKETEQDR